MELITSDHYDRYAALRFRDYRFFSAGYTLSVIGQLMTSTALGWEVYQRTGSKLSLGYVAGIQVIPLVFLALPAGILADRVDRRQLVFFTSLGAMLCSVLLAWISYIQAPVSYIYLVMLALSSFLTIGRPARSSMLPFLVPQKFFANAVTWNSTFFQTAAVTGPALGGFILSHKVQFVYLLDAAFAGVFALLVLLIKPMLQTDKPPPTHPIQMLKEGVRFVYNSKLIFATLTLDLFAVLLGGVVYILPVFASDILHVSAKGFGWLRASDSIGAMSMALLIAHLPPMKKAGKALMFAVAGFGACTILFALSGSFWLSFVLLFIIGALDTISILVRHTLVQVLTPDSMRGRVSAVNYIFIGASNELGGFESGLTAQWMGPRGSAIFGGVGTLLTVLIVSKVFPQIMKIGSLNDIKPPEEPPVSHGFPVIMKNPDSTGEKPA